MEQSVGTEFSTTIGIGYKDEGSLMNTLVSSRRLLVLVYMLVIFTAASQPITDPDFWWHLKTGQFILKTWTIPHTDIFSTVRFGSEWVTHEWLSEAFMYLVYSRLGYGGLIVIFSLIVTAAFAIIYQLCRKRAGHPYVSGFSLILGAAATMPTWGVRPQMFSIFFASIFISFLDKYSRNENTRCVWWLPALMILWVNMHAGFALGLALIVLTIAGILLDDLLLHKNSLGAIWRRLFPLFAVLTVSIAVVSLNPNCARMYSYPFETLTSHSMMRYIQEWKSPDFHEPMFQALSFMILATFSALALSNKRARPGELLILVVTGWATLRSSRNVPFFVIVAMPLLTEHLWDWISSQHWCRWLVFPEKLEIGRKASIKVILNVGLLVAVPIGVVAFKVEHSLAKQVATEAIGFPAGAADFILDHKPPQPIFNEYGWGGYLIWKLYPNYQVFMDGRADVYGDALVEEYVKVHDGESLWRASLSSHGIRTVLVKPDVPLASLLREDTGWEKVFEDQQAVIFVRR